MTDDYEFDASEYEDDIDLSDEHDLNEGEREFWEDSGMPASALIHFNYKNDLGHETDRVVEVQRFTDHSSGLSVLGHCQLRNAIREFRIEWMSRCVDEQTGKPIEDIYEYLFDLYEKTPDYSFDQVAYKHRDTLRAAMHMAGCAGLTEPEQVTVIKQICQQLSGDNRITGAPVSKLIQRCSGENPTGVDHTFRLMAGRLNKSLSPNNKAAVIKLCTKIASLKGSINTGSQESIDYLAKRFSKSE